MTISGKTSLLFTFLLFFSITSYTQTTSVGKNYHLLLTVPYNSISANEQKTYTDQLAFTLSEDKDFKLYNKIMADMVQHVVSRDRTKKLTPAALRPKGKDAAIKYFADQGFSDPVGYINSQNEMIKQSTMIYTKFPELAKLDRSVSKEIMMKAKKGFSADEKNKIKRSFKN